MGDLLRECVSSNDIDPKLNEEINILMKEECIVPVKVIFGLVKKAMEKAGGKVKIKISFILLINQITKIGA